MNSSKGFLSTLLVFFAGVMVACSIGSGASSSTSGTGTTGDVSHLYVVLTGPHAVKAMSTASTHSAEATTQATQIAGCPGIGTITSDDASLSFWPIKTCTGYYANLQEAPTDADFSIPLGPNGNYQVFFDGAACTGNAYTRESPGISGKALVGGFVFFMDMSGTGRNDPDNYWVIEQGEATTDATIVSFFDGNSCQSSSASLTSIYPVKHNSDVLDQAGNPASGLASAPIQGPLNSGTP